MTPGTSRPSPTQNSTACDGSAFSGTPPSRSTRTSPFASILRTTKPSWSMCVKSMTLGAPFVAVERRDQIAEPVGARS